MKTWLKDNGPVIGALAGVIIAFVAVLQLAVVGPMNRGFDDLRSEMSGRFDAFRSEVNGRFEAMDRRFDDLRAEMNGRFEAMDQRFDDLRAEMTQRFDQQDKYVSARFDAMDERIGVVEQRLGRLTDAVSELRTLVTGVGERVSRNEAQIEVIREQLQTVDAPEP